MRAPKSVLFLVRGAPGLGRVSPSIALHREWAGSDRSTYRFVSYLTGSWYLRSMGYPNEEIEPPSEYFIDPLSTSGKRCITVADDLSPELIVIDGEPYMAMILSMLGHRVIYLANPYDLAGHSDAFNLIHRGCLAGVAMVLVPTLEWAKFAEELSSLKNVTVIPPLVRTPSVLKSARVLSEDLRVLVTVGGGSVRAGSEMQLRSELFLESLAWELIAALPGRRGVGSAHPSELWSQRSRDRGRERQVHF